MKAASPRRGRGNGQHPPLVPATVPPADPVLALIERVARDPSADLDKLQRLLDMRRDAERDAAERAFNEALAQCQAAMQPVVADTPNPHANGHKYATYAKLDTVLRPIYTAHGLALTFTTGATPLTDAVEVVAYLIGHGHSRRYSVVMPADGKGPKGGDVMSRTHATASAISYGMRYLLCMAFNVAVIRDDDGNVAGRTSNGVITADQAAHIKKLAGQVRADVRRYCAYMQVRSIDAIPAARYEHAVAALEAKRRAHAAKPRAAQ